MLNRFRDAGYSIILVSNHSDPDFAFANCLNQPWTFLFRRPFGRDFGAFKDATLLLHEISHRDNIRFRKIVYLNDSIVTIEKDEISILKHLDRPDVEFSGITENYNKGHHVGSFVMSIGEKAFYHPKMLKYWRSFESLSTRRYAIGRGELGFSKAMRRSGFVPDIQWTLARMKVAMLKLPMTKLMEIADDMEPHFRRQIESPFHLIDLRLQGFLGADNLGTQARSFLSLVIGDKYPDGTKKMDKRVKVPRGSRNALLNGVFSQSNQAQPSASQDERALSFVRYRDKFANLSEDVQASITHSDIRSEMIDAMLAYVFRGSQIHHGAAPLLHLGAGLLKKDVVLRRIVQPFDIEALLARAVGGVDQSEAAREVLAKGHPSSLSGWAKVLNEWDFT
jgi:hypothetical protein